MAILDSVTTTRAPKEDEAFTINGISITGTATQTVTLTATSGIITFASAIGVTGNGTAAVSYTGTPSQINTAIAGMTFKGLANASGAASFVISTTESGVSSQTVNLNISPVNDAPTMSGGTGLTVNEGDVNKPFNGVAPSTTGFTHAQFGLTEIDNSNAQVIIKLTELPAKGVLKLNGVEIAVGSTFSASQLNTLTFSHNAEQVTAPAGVNDTFKVAIDDGAGGLLSNQAINVTVMPVNQAPTVAGTIYVIEGETAIRLDNNSTLIDPYNSQRGALSITDVDDTITTFTITSLPAHGTLKYNGVSIITAPFTVTDKTLLTYSHDGGETVGAKDTFGISVTDNGGGAGTPITKPATVTVNILPNNDDPVLTTNIMPTVVGGTPLIITAAMLQVTDVDSVASALTYTLTNISGGAFTLNGNTLVVGATFTQADIAAGKLGYTAADGNAHTDSIAFTVKDGGTGIVFPSNEIREGGIYTPSTSNLAVNTFVVNVTPGMPGNMPPQQVTLNTAPTAGGDKAATIIEHGNYTFTSVDLIATDGQATPAEIIYRVLTLPTSGSIELNGTALTFYQSFTQLDVDSGKVKFVHKGEEDFVDTFTYSVSDGSLETAAQSFTLTNIPQNDTPTAATADRVFLAEGGTFTINHNHIVLADADNSVSDNETGYAINQSLTFKISAIPVHGVLKLGTTTLAVNDIVTATQLANNELKYTHDSSEHFADEFKLVPLDNAGVTVTAGTNKTSTGAELTVPIVITSLNDAPIANGDSELIPSEAGAVLEGQAVIIGGATYNTATGNGTTGSSTPAGATSVAGAHISYTDTDNTSEQRQYRITTAPQHGSVLLNGAVLGAGSVVTQEDLDTGKVSYRHDGSENLTDEIRYVVSDGDYTVAGGITSAQGTAAPTPAVYRIEILPTNDAPKMSGPTTIINLDNTSAPNPITGFSLADSDLTTLTAGETDFVQVTVRLLGATGTPFADVNAYSGVTLAVTASGATVDATNGYLIVRGTSTAVNTALGTLNVTVPTDLDIAYKVQVIVDDRLRNGSGVLISDANGGTTNQNQTAGGTPTVIDTTELNWYTTPETIPTTHTANVSASSVIVRASSVNDPATLSNSNATLTINEDVATPINGFAVSDAESLAFALPVTVTLSASHGTLGIAGSGAQTTTTVNGHSITIAGDNSGSLVLTGQAADIQELLNNAATGLTYTSPLNGNHDYNGGADGDVTLTVSLDDAGSRIGGDVGVGSVAANPANVIIPITLNAINDKPGVTASITPVTISAAGGAVAIPGFGVTDVDYTDGGGITTGEVDFIQVIVRITDSAGTPLAATPGIMIGSTSTLASNGTDFQIDTTENGNGHALIIRGTGANVNDYLNKLTLTYPAGANPDTTFKVQVIADDRLRVVSTGALDGSNKANGGFNVDGNVPTVAIDPYTHTEAQITAAGFAVNNVTLGVNTVFVSTVNDPAAVTANNVTVAENSATVEFNATNGNFVVNDSDDNGANTMSATVTVSKGTITAVGTGGAVSGLNTGTITITGATEAQLNSQLKAITVTLIDDVGTPTSADWNGNFTATVVVNDGGNTGVRPATIPGDTNIATANPGDYDYAANDTTANLTTTRTITVNVTPVNDAPTRVDANPVTLTAILEDTTGPAGDTVANLFGSKFTDTLDTITNGSTANTFAGIAITTNAANASTQGVWQYSINSGTNWTALPAATNAAAVQLHPTDLIRFVPVADYNGAPGGLTARLIDSSVTAFTSGVTTVDVSNDTTKSGGTTAYSNSSNAVILNTSVTAVNDPAAVNATNVTVNENAATLVFDATNGNFIVNDPDDNGANTLSATVTVSKGTITAVGNGGAVTGLNTNIITITGATEAQLNSQLKAITVTFINDNSKGSVNWNGSFDATVVVNDGGNTGARPATIAGDTNSAIANPGDYNYAANDSTANLTTTRTIAVNVSAVNDAPTRVDANPVSLAAILEDNTAPAGDTVANLFGSKFIDSLDTITNGSTANSFAGIAITTNPATVAEGKWQYSTNGTTWVDLPSVSTASALQLQTTDLLRFLPTANYNGTPGALIARLIDSSITFTSGSTVNVTTSGGTNAYSDSSNAVTLNTSVTPVNDAPQGSDKTIPILVNSPSYTITAADFGFSDPLDSPAHLLSNVIVTSLPATTEGVYKLGSTPLIVNQVLTKAEIDGGTLKFMPAANVVGTSGTMGFAVQDNGGTSTGVDTDQTPNTLRFSTNAPVASIAVSPATVVETGVNKLIYTVTLSVAPVVDTVINLSTSIASTATAGLDYTAAPTTVTVKANETTATIEIDPTDDAPIEANETIILSLSIGNGYTVTSDTAKQSATGTIIDNTLPTASIAIATASIQEDGTPNLVYTVTLDKAPINETTVNISTSGTATTANGDYTGNVTTVVFPAGQTSQTITIDPTTDTIVEANETVILTITSGTGYNIGTASATGTITNDDMPVATIAISPADMFEDAAGLMTYTVTLDKVSPVPTVVNFSVAGTASSVNDYVSSVSTLAVTIPANSLSTTITIDPTVDTLGEYDETVVIKLESGTGYTVGSAGSATGTIKNDDALPAPIVVNPVASISVNPAAVAEDGAPNLIYTITLSQAPVVDTVVKFTTSGTASYGTDYSADVNVQQVTVLAGQTTAKVTVDPTTDTLEEPNETVILKLIDGTGYTVDTAKQEAIGTINNVDLPIATIAVNPSTVNENGALNLVYKVTLSYAPLVTTTVNLTKSGTTVDADYAGLVTSLTFAPGETTKTATIVPQADGLLEANETVVLTLASGQGYTVTNDASLRAASGVIVDADLPIASISVDPAAVAEDGSPNLIYTITLSQAPVVDTVVKFNTSGTASFGSDYSADVNVQQVTILAGQTTAKVTVDPTADILSEPNETVILSLMNGSGYTLDTSKQVATGTITNDDAPIVSIAVNPASVAEAGTSNLVYTITMSQVRTTETVINLTTSGTAVNADYTGTVTSLTIPAGKISGIVTIIPSLDAIIEPDETVILSLASGEGYTVTSDTAKQSATGTITDANLPVASISVTDVPVTENGISNLIYTVSLDKAPSTDLLINLSTSGTAVNEDYTGAVASVTIKAGQTSATIAIDPTPDAIREPDESVVLKVMSGIGYTVSPTKHTATGTITDANLAPEAIGNTVYGYLNKPVSLSLLGSDADGTVASVTVKTLPPVTEGKLYLPDGFTPVTVDMVLTPAVASSLQFIPVTGFEGTSRFDFTVTDNLGLVDASPATMIVKVSQVTIDLPPQFDSGKSNTDNITNITTVDLTGNALPDAVVKVTLPDGSVLPNVIANAQGLWTIPAVNLTAIKNDAGIQVDATHLNNDGLFTFKADSFDKAGNALATAVPLVITVDTVAPDKPTTIKLTEESDRINGSGNNGAIDGVTADSTPKFNVTLPLLNALNPLVVGDTVKLYAIPEGSSTSQFVGEHVLTAAEILLGNVDLTTTILPDGLYTFSTQIVDLAGNVKDDAKTTATIITDLDGIVPITELAVKGGDFNQDGISDWLQNGVTTFPVLPTTGVSGSSAFNAGANAPTAAFGSLVAMNLTNPQTTTNNLRPTAEAQFEKVSVLPFSDAKFVGQATPAGLIAVTDPVQFTITNIKTDGGKDEIIDLDPTRAGVQTRVVLDIPEGVYAETFVKFGPTPSNATPHFFEFLADGNLATYDDGAELFRNGVGKVDRVVLTLTDNGIGDSDARVGYIADPGYLAVRQAEPTPTPTPSPTPAPIPAPAPIPSGGAGAGAEVCPNDVVIDGVTAEKLSFNVMVVPVVTAARLEDSTSTNKLLADIPVVIHDKAVLLQVSIPEHVGFTAEELVVPCHDFTLRELLIAHAEPRVEPLVAYNTILQQGIDKFLPTVVDEKQVMVRTLIFNQDNTTLSNQPIIVTGALGKGEGDVGHPLRQEALVIDAHTLPAGSVIQLDNVEFAIVIGDVKVIGGAGSNFIMGDDGVQVFSTADKNDVVMGNIGDDTLTAGTGHNLLDGGAGVDTLVLNPTGELRVYLTHNAANKVNPYDQVVVDVASGEQTIYRNVEKVNLNGTVFDLGFLNLPGSQMETLGVLSQLLFNQAPGVAFVSQWGNVSANPTALISQVLASDAAKASLDKLDDADFSKMIVKNGLDSTDPKIIAVVQDYLQTNGRAALIEMAVKAPIVLEHLYSNGGLAIIANDHSPVTLVTEAELVPSVNKTEQVPLPASTHVHTVGRLEDGTAVVDRHIERLAVPIVTTARIEDTTTPNKTLADIPVIKNGNEVILNVGLPVSVGLVAEEIVSDDGKPLALRDLLVASVEPRIEPLSASSDVVKQGIDSIVASVKDASQVAVRTLIFSQDTQILPNEPIVIQGALGKGESDVAHPLRQEALVIDAHTLAAGTTIQLNNVEFAVVIGNVKVIGGNGSNFVIADDADQNIMTGAGDDTLMGGAGNDRLNGGWGNDLVDGGIGEDTLVYDFKPNDPLHVYLTRNSEDKEHPYDTVVVNGRTGDHTIFRNVEKADLNDTIVDINYLEQSGSKLEKIGVLSQFLLGHAPGAAVIASLESVADDTSALINQFLASDMVKTEIAGLSNHDLATLLVNNGLGTSDAGAIQFCENYLQEGHSVADLVLIGMNYAPVVNHAYGAEGLTLI